MFGGQRTCDYPPYCFYPRGNHSERTISFISLVATQGIINLSAVILRDGRISRTGIIISFTMVKITARI